MAKSDKSNAVALRGSIITEIVRALAWPCVALIAMYCFSDTVDRLVRGLNKASIFGFEFERLVDETSLSSEQLKILQTLTPDDILNFFSRYEGDNQMICMTDSNPRYVDKVFFQAGLIEIRNENENICSGSYFSKLSEEGVAMRAAIFGVLRSAISNVVGS